MRRRIFSLNAGMLLACVCVLPGPAPAVDPLWWSQRGITRLDGGGQPLPASDFSLLNQGQLKHLAAQAVAEMNARLTGGAGTTLNALVAAWTPPVAQSDDYATINLGQLKNLAAPFYARLFQVGYRGQPFTAAMPGWLQPWSPLTTDDSDFSHANIGQAKSLFSFEFVRDSNTDGVPDWIDSDADGMPDAWELQYFGDIHGALAGPAADWDGDGASNLAEYRQGRNPTKGVVADSGGVVSLEVFTPLGQ